jgi:uncharacterized membrane protein YoaK (UPF0700 family)
MTDLMKARFITLNYDRLQGLKALPPGLLLFGIILWTNGQTGRARDLSIPLLMFLCGVIVYALIDRYYRANYGRVEQPSKFLWLDVVLSTAAAILAMAGFAADMASAFPISLYALIFAVILFFDYVRMVRRTGGLSLTIFTPALLFIGLLALTALLPLAGRETWKAIGFRSPYFLVYGVDGILISLYGIAGHLFLAGSMHSIREVKDEQSV